MTFAGVMIGCWLAIAAVAFLAISGLGRLAGRGDVEAELGIVGEAELRMLVGERHDPGARQKLHDRFALALDGSSSAFDLGGYTR
jgi:hypothetical protein